jgi:hypothetical protein
VLLNAAAQSHRRLPAWYVGRLSRTAAVGCSRELDRKVSMLLADKRIVC